MTEVVRSWWPVPAFLAVVVAVQLRVTSGDDVAGHAAAHAANGTVVFAATFAVAVLVWAAPPALRRRPALWVLLAGFWAAALLETIANRRVIDAIGGDDWTDAEAARFGPARPGFESGHELSNLAEWSLKGVSIVLAVWLLRTGAVPRTLGRVAVFAGVIALPWIIPGIGGFLAVLGVAVMRARRLRSSQDGGDRGETTLVEVR